jgi:cob(I)alamin adenosyltransferase
MKIYTRTGDDGTTGLPSGRRVLKSDPAIGLCGTIDELNCIIGAALAANPAERVRSDLKNLQDQLFRLGAEIAMGEDGATWHRRILLEDIEWLEAGIDLMSDELPPLRNFILPGGLASAAQIHLARAVCRRAEREAVSGMAQSPGSFTFVYLNRLSDFLFTLARYENFLGGGGEEKWS